MSKNESKVNLYDKMVSEKLRQFRILKTMSQAEVASIIGVSIQQVQKYEACKNRISAGRLYNLAKSLKIDVANFFDFGTKYEISENSGKYIGIKMLKYFDKLSEKQKKVLLELIKAIVEEENQEEVENDESRRIE